MTCLTQRVLASSALTCFTVQLRRRFCWRRSSTRPATMSDGTTSRSRKNSVNSRATSSNEFCKHDVIMSHGGSGSKSCDSAVVCSTCTCTHATTVFAHAAEEEATATIPRLLVLTQRLPARKQHDTLRHNRYLSFTQTVIILSVGGRY